MEEHEPQQFGNFHYADHQRKLAEIHRERDEIERQLVERCRQLEVYHSQQEQVRERRADRLLDNLRKERKMLLNQEAKRFNAAKPEFQYIRENTGILENVLSERTKEFVKSQQEISQNRRDLHREHHRLQVARQKLRESRMFHGDRSPVPSPVSHVEVNRPSLYDKSSVLYNSDMRSVRGVDSVIQDTADQIPDSIKRCWTLREGLDEEYNRKYKPYNNELGPDSYPPWQKESYAMVRAMVVEFIDEVLDKHIPTVPKSEKKVPEGLLAGEKTVNLLAEEIILKVTSELTQDVASEEHQLVGCVGNVVSKTLMAAAERVALGHNEGRSRRDPNYNLITKAFFTHQKDRDLHRPGLWLHTQQVFTKKVKEEEDKKLPKGGTEKEEEEEDLGVTLIEYDHVLPIDVGLPLVAAVGDSDKWEQLAHQSYITKELQFWQDMDPFLFQTSLSKRCRGMTCVQPSADHSHLAIGTGHGDLLVFALWTEPWLLVRVAINTDKSPDPVRDISWSRDHTHLTSVNSQGGVQLWSMLPWGKPVEKSLLKLLGVGVLSESYLPYSLSLLLSLHHDDNDFRFQEGPLAERKVAPSDQFPTHAAFSTDLTLLGNQHSVCIALEKGDILKCDTEEATMIYTNQRRDSKQDDNAISQSEAMLQNFATRFLGKPKSTDSPGRIGQGVATELLRKHTARLFLIGFVDNCGDMVTVDEKGYVNLWDNSSETSGADWLEPVQRFRLSLHKTMYTTTSDSPTKVIFSEKELREKRSSRQEIDKQRKIAEQSLKTLSLGDPWHIQPLPAQRLKTQIYLPNDLVTSTGAHFYLVMRRQPGNDLYMLFTRLYKPSQVKCSRFLGCVMNPAGTEVIFLLLFPETPPKAPHVSVIVLCLHGMAVRDIRLDIPLSQADHDHLLTDNHVSFHVSRVHAVLGADYLFLSLRGALSVYSLLTGQTVLKLEDRNKPSDFGGCSINILAWNQPVNSRLTVCSGMGKLLVINYAEKANALTVLELTDGVTEEDNTTMKAAFRRWGRHSLPPPEQRLTDQAYSITPPLHPEVFVRSLILELVDRAVPAADETPTANYIQRGYRAVIKKILGKLHRNS